MNQIQAARIGFRLSKLTSPVVKQSPELAERIAFVTFFTLRALGFGAWLTPVEALAVYDAVFGGTTGTVGLPLKYAHSAFFMNGFSVNPDLIIVFYPEGCTESEYQHELGHVRCGHDKWPAWKRLFWPTQVQMEVEASRWAIAHGADPVILAEALYTYLRPLPHGLRVKMCERLLGAAPSEELRYSDMAKTMVEPEGWFSTWEAGA